MKDFDIPVVVFSGGSTLMTTKFLEGFGFKMSRLKAFKSGEH